jgi:uncharacterized spore protein YtfJ
MDKFKLVKALGSAWILLVLSIIVAWFINAYREIQDQKATGLGAVAGGGVNIFPVLVIAFLVVSGVALLIMRFRTR